MFNAKHQTTKSLRNEITNSIVTAKSSTSSQSLDVIPSQKITEVFRSILFELVDLDMKSYQTEALLREDLGMDSLDMVELVMICEKEFLLSLPDQDWLRARTVGDLEHLIISHVNLNHWAKQA